MKEGFQKLENILLQGDVSSVIFNFIGLYMILNIKTELNIFQLASYVVPNTYLIHKEKKLKTTMGGEVFQFSQTLNGSFKATF